MIGRWRFTRSFVRFGCFLVAVVLLWPVPFRPESSKLIVAASPFLVVCGIIATGTFKAVATVGILTGIMSVFRKRWFCRYVCPTGLLQDGAFRIGIRKSARWPRFPSVGRYIVVATIVGALFGYPLLWWMDPLAIFSSAFSVRTSTNILDGILAAAGLSVLLVLAVTTGDLWCSRVCPLGASQDLLDHLRLIVRKKISRSVRLKDGAPCSGVSTTRRVFLAVAAGAGLGLLAKRTGNARGDNAPLRPPGSVKEDTFSGLCLRCGNCIRACPTNIIRPDTGQAGIAGFLAPVVQFENGYCLEDCNACTRICPSGAIKSLSLEQKRQHRIGEALVDGKICFLVQGKSDCDVCVRSCPFEAVQVYWDENLYIAYPNVDFEKCNGCGACQVYCPTGDIKAIRVWKTENKILPAERVV
jgi:ferredoxin-type protein NapF